MRERLPCGPGPRFLDSDGLQLELIGAALTGAGEPWAQGGISLEEAIRSVHSVYAVLEGYERTAKLLTEMFGYRLVQHEGNRFRFVPNGEGAIGCILFEIATDTPGFTTDEPLEELGQKLKLPKRLETQHAHLEGLLPKLL